MAARFPVVGPVAINVVDGYADDEGKLEARVLGVRMLRATGREAAIGEALRYLSELPWVPHAMAHNRELEWRELDGRPVEVATRVGGERVAVEFAFDDAGDVVRMSSSMRPFRVGKRLVPTPWGGAFDRYEVLGGVRIPTSAEVYWDLPGGRFTYWRGTVTSYESLNRPFPRRAG